MSKKAHKIKLVKTAIDKTILRNLWQLYCYEFSQMLNFPIPKSGKFPLIDLELENESCDHYLYYFYGNLAGFAVVAKRSPSDLTGTASVMEIFQFYVAPYFRKRGCGRELAKLLISLHPASEWEIFEMEQNTGAITFWRKIVKEVSQSWQEDKVDIKQHTGIVQRFRTT